MKKLIILLVMMFVCSKAFALSELKKTICPSGCDYSTLESCMNGNEQNLVAADKYFNVEISGDWESTGIDSTQVTIHNYTVSATQNIRIYTVGDAKNDGTKEGTPKAYRIRYILGRGGSPSAVIDGLKFDGSGTSGMGLYLFSGGSTTPSIVRKCVFLDYTGNAHAPTNTGYTNIYNNFYYNCTRAIYGGSSASTTIIGYNNVALDGTFGFLRATFYNSFAGNNSLRDYFALSASSDNLVCSDTTCNGVTNYATGKSSYSDYFVDVGSGTEDYHLKDTSLNLWGLSGGDYSGIFTDDFDGDTRSAWDIGADEFVSAGGVTGSTQPTYIIGTIIGSIQ